MIKIIIILIILFLIHNYFSKETFSNAYQDSEINSKISFIGSNISVAKPLLTLYYDRRDEYCKYFYDYFSTYYGTEITSAPPPNTKLSEIKQPWNQLKHIYRDSDFHELKKYIFLNPSFLNIEEIEVDQFNLWNFNDHKAHKVKNNGTLEQLGDGPRKYKQLYRKKDFLKRIPLVTLTFLKHKSQAEMLEIIKEEKIGTETPNVTYGRLNDMQKYNITTITYDGAYSPNNRAVRTTLDNMISFITESCETYLKTTSQPDHQNRIDARPSFIFMRTTATSTHPHQLGVNIPSTNPIITKCNKCSEFIYTTT